MMVDMVETVFQRHLSERGMSGRAVRYRVLSASRIATLQDEAAKLAGGSAKVNNSVFRNLFLSQVLPFLVVAFTEPTCDPMGAQLEWNEATVADLLFETGAWDRVFTARDTAQLTGLFSARHEIRRVERMALLAQPPGWVHLCLPNMSGKLVRYDLLGSRVLQEADNQAAIAQGEDGTVLGYRNAYLHGVLPRFVRGVSKAPVALAEKQGPVEVASMAEDVGMLSLTPDALGWGPAWDGIFSARETAALELVFASLHEVGLEELEMLSGKDLPVTTEG